jgi:type II secretory ATPase GspE/PulE/Tfp pilus assembly ATPase PilB-like protein
MGIDPYLIAPTLKMAMAQRLARTLCADSGLEQPVDHSTTMRIEDTFKTLPEKYRDRIPDIKTMLHPEPKPGCSTGYRGRTAVTEVLEVTEEMQELILNNASEEDIFTMARKNGFVTIIEDAIIKALNHEIPYEEMNVFGTKIGLEEPMEPLSQSPVEPIISQTVDNSSLDTAEAAIIKPNE